MTEPRSHPKCERSTFMPALIQNLFTLSFTILNALIPPSNTSLKWTSTLSDEGWKFHFCSPHHCRKIINRRYSRPRLVRDPMNPECRVLRCKQQKGIFHLQATVEGVLHVSCTSPAQGRLLFCFKQTSGWTPKQYLLNPKSPLARSLRENRLTGNSEG